MDHSFYGLLIGAILLLLLLFHRQKKTDSGRKRTAAETAAREDPSHEISSLYAAEKILDFLVYFESLPVKNDARRFLLTASTFEIMLYQEALGSIFLKHQRQLEEKHLSPDLVRETYLERIKAYLGGDNGLVHFLAFSAELRLSDDDPATPALCIPLTCGTRAQREKIISETAKRYEKRYQRPFPYKIFAAPDPPL